MDSHTYASLMKKSGWGFVVSAILAGLLLDNGHNALGTAFIFIAVASVIVATMTYLSYVPTKDFRNPRY